MFTPSTPGLAQPQQPFMRLAIAAIVEAHAVDDRRVLGEAKQPRLWVADLRLGRERADLDEAEAERERAAGRFGVLVEARGEADRVGEFQAERFDLRARVVLAQARPAAAPQAPARRADARSPRGAHAEPARQAGRMFAERSKRADLVRTVVAVNDRARPAHRAHRQRRIKMREKIAAAGRLVAQAVPQRFRVHGGQNERTSSGKPFA